MPHTEGSFAESAPVKTVTAVDDGLRAYMMRVYNYMAGGIALTGVIAYLTYFASVTQRTDHSVKRGDHECFAKAHSAGKRLFNVVIYGLMFLALLAAVALAPRLLRRSSIEETTRWIEIGELAPRLDGAKALAVIDVRRPDEFVGPLGHIPKARNVPLAELPNGIEELRALVETPVVLVCRTDNRSARAVALLKEAGFRNVVVLRGGMVRWNEAGLPVADRLSPTGEAASR